MKTTELFVEQMLIGLLVLAAGGLLMPGQPMDAFWNLGPGESAAVLAVAYLIGVVYDRCADTILQDLERHHELWFTVGLVKGSKPEKETFPLSNLRIKILESDTATDYAHYLRSRIRLTRAMATLAPALSIGLLNLEMKDDGYRVMSASLVLVTYLAVFFIKLSKTQEEVATNRKPKSTDKLFKLSAEEYEDYIRRTGFDKGRKTNTLPFILRYEEAATGAIVVTLGSILVAFFCTRDKSAVYLIPVAGLALTVLFGWAWWRISTTFYRFVRRYGKVVSKER